MKSVVRFFGGGGGDLAAASNAGTGAVRYIEHHKKREETNMTKEQSLMIEDQESHTGPKAARFLGSLKDALAAAGRDETGGAMKHMQSDAKAAAAVPPPIKTVAADPVGSAGGAMPEGKTALEAAREARASTATADSQKPVKIATAPTTHVVKPEKAVSEDGPARTQLVRGKQAVERGTFGSDPVVGWLVVVGGPGIGQYRPIFEGNNAVGRSSSQRIPLDFGDDSISSEEQAFIRYDSSDRSFLFVPNLAKTNVVSVNNKRPTGAVELSQMDVIQMGRSQIVFVPFCGADFDWAELIDKA